MPRTTASISVRSASAASFKRHPEDKTRYDQIRLLVNFEARIGEDIAEASIRNFTDNCPIYNTLRRGGPISIARMRAG